ncbi:MAG: AbrB/MazE/SpoVT family DNA-binding domain-containing protein [Nanoarchaeota archaeon]|nr:AbrB/MazE/SpoVT family DNA-binding domain-containing protein [Nanoarchaeota archaeon]MBU1005467.1 AbrB/MazE/SpoVT family DNA-binding domain-containing protein [Nanoarchaeota archaeon]MBU1947037.1 AbrB/MazE/SpoVT family DNA-binding domain-containing protein [Nanoarchaeota archaeon]
MRKCSDCKVEMKELTAKTPEGIEYTYFKCGKCGEEILNMDQLHNVAEKYREMKRFHAKVSKWGMSLGLRIPKELVQKYNFKNNEEVTMIPEKEGIKIIPA